MTWTKSETLALADERCMRCMGYGMRLNGVDPCNCVLRRIFRTCYARFRDCVEYTLDAGLGSVRLEPVSRAVNSSRTFGRKKEEFKADFCLIAKRSLKPKEYELFRFHWLLGADWKICCRRLELLRGEFFHSVYRVEQKLGRAFRETEPYGLFPLDEYFGGAVRTSRAAPCDADPDRDDPQPVRAPLKKAA